MSAMKKFLLIAVGIVVVSASLSSAAEGAGRKLLEAGPFNTTSSNTGTQLNNGADVKNKGSVKGDPVLSAFDGQRFEFHGKADHFYNLASEPGVFQLSTLLKPAMMFDHNGTYMRGVALEQNGARVVVETRADFEEDIEVSVNGKVLEIEDSATKSTKRTIMLEDGSSLEVEWQLYAPEIGPYVLIRSESILVAISLTAPFPDAGGVLQPSYLNANVTLMREPTHDLQGVLGETYNPLRNKADATAVAAPQYPLYDDSKYELEGYFGATTAQTLATLMQKLRVDKPVGTLSRR